MKSADLDDLFDYFFSKYRDGFTTIYGAFLHI